MKINNMVRFSTYNTDKTDNLEKQTREVSFHRQLSAHILSTQL